MSASPLEVPPPTSSAPLAPERTTSDVAGGGVAAVVGGAGGGFGGRSANDTLARGVAWSALGKTLSQAVAWGSTLIVARLLSPDAYGVIGMAGLYFGLLQMLAEFGIGSVIVSKRGVDDALLPQLNTLSVLLGATGALVGVVTAPLVGMFYKDPRLPLVLVVMSSSFVVLSLRSVPWALLQRDLRFKRIAAYDAVQGIALAVLSVVLAVAGADYWTLVAASVLSGVISTAVAVTAHPVPFARPQWRRLRAEIAFGGNMVVQRLGWYAYTNADFLVAGRVLGSQALGAYTLAYTLANAPVGKISTMLFGVTQPVFARLRDDLPALQRMILSLCGTLMLIVMPLTFGLAAVAPDLVPVLLGTKWLTMVLPLQVLSAYAGFTLLYAVLNQVLVAIGHERVATRYNLVQLLVMPAAFYVGARTHGIVGLAVAWLVVHPPLAIAMLTWSLRAVGIGVREFVREALWPSLSACAVMVVSVLSVRLAGVALSPAPRLAIQIAAGVLGFAAALWVLHRARVLAALDLIRRLRERR